MQARTAHFLLVEDDDDHAILVQRTLQHNRFVNTMDRVVDGSEAMAYLRREEGFADHPDPDAILLDLKLPKLDGHEVLAMIRSDPALRMLPVVIITTSDAETDRIRAYENHVNSYVVKPLDYDQFHRMVDELGTYWAHWNQTATS